MSTYLHLRNVGHAGESLLSDQLEHSLWHYFTWGSLNIGGFFNVTIPTSGIYGGDFSRLRLVNDPNYASGQVWEGFRKDWIWETGIDYGTQPIRVSGVFVNNTFRSLSASGYSHHVDYPQGRIVFDTAISPTSLVQVNHSFRWHQWYTADAEWWQELQNDSFRPDQGFLIEGSGAWNTLSRHRIQLPAVVIETTTQSDHFGYEQGNKACVVRQDVRFHIFTETHYDRKYLHDVISGQRNCTILLFDKNRVLQDGVYPLLYDGSPSPSGRAYPDLVKPSGQGYLWKTTYAEKMRGRERPKMGRVFCDQVIGTFEVVV